MLDMKLIRQNPEVLKNALKMRNMDLSIDEILNLDVLLRAKQVESQSLAAERNALAKEIGAVKSKGGDASELLASVAQSKELEEKLVGEAKALEAELFDKLSYIPNIPDSSVPYGVSEADNVEVRRVGDIRSFDFKPKEHYELGEELGMMDFEAAAAMAGSRFVVLSSDLARLERAIANFMLDLHTGKNGYKEHNLPVILRSNALFNTAQLPKFKEDLFRVGEEQWLIPTTEVPLTNLVADKFVNREELPMRNTGLSLCFRSEAGSAGRDTKGMLRQHQFYKVELVSIASPEDSMNELEYMTSCAEEVLKQLEIPYRVVLLCSGDMGFSSKKTYDIEAWLPGQNTYREISSCSNCGDFQARRMQAKIKDKDSKEYPLVHTLNGSGLAVGRTLIAIMENYQQADGSILIPKVLQKYMGKDVIERH
ncbi:MAG: serine--tRNA ligase [Alphaproteobacteria bacterium]|jgi:seryl-tRNA synthetase|nr:serine--tRNA ligase [Alphaproteobacteria bacterium]